MFYLPSWNDLGWFSMFCLVYICWIEMFYLPSWNVLDCWDDFLLMVKQSRDDSSNHNEEKCFGHCCNLHKNKFVVICKIVNKHICCYLQNSKKTYLLRLKKKHIFCHFSITWVCFCTAGVKSAYCYCEW